MDQDPEAETEGSVIKLDERQIARLRARRDIPTKQRDFMELWDEDDPRIRSRPHRGVRLTR